MYQFLKSVHVGAVTVSGTLFVLRYILLQLRPQAPLPKLLRIAPHLNDTVLLVAAIVLTVHLGLNPLSSAWLGVKLIAVVVYIVLGMICFRLPVHSPRQIACFLLAIATFAWIVFTATSKQALR